LPYDGYSFPGSPPPKPTGHRPFLPLFPFVIPASHDRILSCQPLPPAYIPLILPSPSLAGNRFPVSWTSCKTFGLNSRSFVRILPPKTGPFSIFQNLSNIFPPSFFPPLLLSLMTEFDLLPNGRCQLFELPLFPFSRWAPSFSSPPTPIPFRTVTRKTFGDRRQDFQAPFSRRIFFFLKLSLLPPSLISMTQGKPFNPLPPLRRRLPMSSPVVFPRFRALCDCI